MTNFVCIRQPSALTYFKGVCHLNLALISLMVLLLARVIRCSVVVGDERNRIKKNKKKATKQQPQIGGVHTVPSLIEKGYSFVNVSFFPFCLGDPHPPPPPKKNA